MKMPTTRHRRLVERGGRKAFVRDKVLAHKKGEKNKNLRGYHNIHSVGRGFDLVPDYTTLYVRVRANINSVH